MASLPHPQYQDDQSLLKGMNPKTELSKCHQELHVSKSSFYTERYCRDQTEKVRMHKNIKI